MKPDPIDDDTTEKEPIDDETEAADEMPGAWLFSMFTDLGMFGPHPIKDHEADEDE